MAGQKGSRGNQGDNQRDCSDTLKIDGVRSWTLLIRLILSGYVWYSFGYYVLAQPNPLQLMRALTFQGVLLIAISFSFGVVLQIFLPNLKGGRIIDANLRMVAYSIALFITMFSWVAKIPVDQGGLWTYKNHFFHTINTVLCVLMTVLDGGERWKFRDFYKPLLYGLAYMVVEIGLQKTGHGALYVMLDLDHDPVLFWITILISCILIPICHFIYCMLTSQFERRQSVNQQTATSSNRKSK